jgi:glycerophosphoryl diester phosphodiesterase
MYFRITVLFFFLVSCSKSKNYEAVLVFGHGGNGLEILNSFYHDNSLEAIDLILNINGSNGVEVDVQLSADGELWLYHDNYLDNETNGEGCVNEKNSAYLETLYYNTVAKEKLVKLGDVNLNMLKNKHLYLDLRHYNFCKNELIVVNKVIQRLQALEFDHLSGINLYCVVSTNLWVQPLLDAGFQVMSTVSDINDFKNIIQQYPEVSGAVVNNKFVNADDIKYLESLDKKVVIFEVRSPKGIRSALKKYPFGIMTDDIRTALIEKY